MGKGLGKGRISAVVEGKVRCRAGCYGKGIVMMMLIE